MHVSMKIKTLRKERGLTQKALAATIGLSYEAINSYESKKRLPNAKATFAIEKFFKINGEELFGDTFD